MAVNLSPVGGVAAQFFTNTGAVLTGGKIYTYAAGTTTPATTFTSSQGTTAWTNPIVLDAAGRVSGSGEIWLTDGVSYKFVLKDSNDVLIATYDNVSGINSNFVAFVNQQEIVTATAGQTVFDLSIDYSPATNSLSVFVDGVNQYGPGAQYSYVETDSNTVTFNSGLHVGAEVKFTTSQLQGGGAVDASQVSYIPPYTASVATNVEAKLSEYVSVMDFGAVGDGVVNDTAAMQAAHNTGKLIYYPVGVYSFTTITIASGGIVGEGKETILKSTDTSSNDLITYTGVDSSGLLINTNGALFENFTLETATSSQKSGGAGIKISPANYGGQPNENYLTSVEGVYIKNIPTSISFSLSSFFSVRNSYFSFYSVAGLYAVIDNATFQDNGDNEISGNWFYTNSATCPTGSSILYRCGGGRILGNKINGGYVGIDISPLRGTSIAIIEGNSVENQTGNAIRGYINSDFVPIGALDGFSFVQIVGNQIGGYNLTGPAITLNSYASDPKFYNCMVSDNVIYNPSNTTSRAIDIRQVDRFIVANNFVDNATVGYGSFFAASTATSGLVTRNQFLRAATSNILNSSTSTTMDQIVAEYSTTYDPASISAGASLTLAVTVTGASLGNYVNCSFSNSLNGVTLTAYVSAADTVTFVFFNGTASPVDLTSGTIRARVTSN